MPAPQVVDNISELSTIMKTVFGPAVVNQQNLTPMAYKKFSTSKTTFGGNSYEFPARMVNSQSVGARGYRLSLPEPILNVDVTARVRHKFIYGTFDIPGPDIEKGKGNVNAFVNTLTDKMNSVTAMVLKDMNMQTYLDGTGVRATVTATGAAGVIPVNQVKYLRASAHVNMVIGTTGNTFRGDGDSDAGDGAGSTYNAKRWTVLGINAATPSVTLAETTGGVLVATQPTTPGAVTAGDFLVRHKTIGVELTGLDAIVDDGVANPAAVLLQDIDRSISTLWQSKVLHNSGTPQALTNNLMQLAMDIPEVLSGQRVDLLLGSYNARDAYLKLLVPQKRFMDLKLDGGFQVLEYNGRAFMVDMDCQDDTIYFLTKSTIEKFGLFDLKFVEQGGGILKHQSLAAGDVFYGYLRAICNFGTTQANANSKITDLEVDANYRVSA